MCIVSIEQVSETSAEAILFIYGEVNAKREEERSSKTAGKGLYVSPLDVVCQVRLRGPYAQYLFAA